jgi:hypothetical protein
VTSESIRGPMTDRLVTPPPSTFLIEYQPSRNEAVVSVTHDLLIRNIRSVARLATSKGLPLALSTVRVAAHRPPPTSQELNEILPHSG